MRVRGMGEGDLGWNGLRFKGEGIGIGEVGGKGTRGWERSTHSCIFLPVTLLFKYLYQHV